MLREDEAARLGEEDFAEVALFGFLLENFAEVTFFGFFIGIFEVPFFGFLFQFLGGWDLLVFLDRRFCYLRAYLRIWGGGF